MNFAIYGWCVLGIAISVVLPILWQSVYRYFPKQSQALRGVLRGECGLVAPIVLDIWKIIRPYLLLGLASAVAGVLIIAILGDTIKDYRAAILAGYAWDSTLQKFRQ